MRIRKLVVTSLLAIATTGLAVATAHGESTLAEDPYVLKGTDRGISYSTGLSDDRKGVTTNLSSGRFDLAPDGSAVTVNAPDGTMIERWPMVFDMAGYHVQLDPELSADGSSLTLRSAAPDTLVDNVTDFNRALQHDAFPQLEQQQPQAKEVGVLGALVGGIAGAAIGAVVFTVIGAVFLVVGAIPGFFVGAVIGAVLGGIAGFFIL
ncbi:hypothetical protein [Nocardia mexicana]|uniref:DUF8020 domain-containing protein n=1 Tax=Nocardia mexicana TaxID=279262 RepID=A0A370GI67_9NOCA|nr:hypothetical protein [Nocardia mexicana]RDI43508.1 hypothetical protein DFR68_12166 [Nocardia mexicana]